MRGSGNRAETCDLVSAQGNLLKDFDYESCNFLPSLVLGG